MLPMYDVRFRKFPSLRAKLAKFAVSCWLTSFIHRKRKGNGMNEPEENFSWDGCGLEVFLLGQMRS